VTLLHEPNCADQEKSKQKHRNPKHLQLLARVLASLARRLLGEQVCRNVRWMQLIVDRLSAELTLVNVGKDTALCDCDVAKQLVQLLVVPDSKLKMAGNDTGLLVVTGSVAGQLENLSRKVFEDGSQIDGSAGTDTLSVVALAKQTVHTTDRESQTGLGGTAIMDEVSKWFEKKVALEDAFATRQRVLDVMSMFGNLRMQSGGLT